mmetsp:Transcript_61945/g.98139  ORF Transcript_61945/g.98139 Transcript_61945/m.98139 type:complete len:87 (+) Transcript_61945:1053-1313(+)
MQPPNEKWCLQVWALIAFQQDPPVVADMVIGMEMHENQAREKAKAARTTVEELVSLMCISRRMCAGCKCACAPSLECSTYLHFMRH